MLANKLFSFCWARLSYVSLQFEVDLSLLFHLVAASSITRQ